MPIGRALQGRNIQNLNYTGCVKKYLENYMIQLLVVDDDDINNFLLSHLLKKSIYPVQKESFTNPVEALSYIKKSISENKRIDLILLDINMPQMTGWDVLNELREEGESIIRNKRIYMLSSSVHATDIEQANRYPEISGYISKPITLDLLSELFKEITESNEELS